MVWYRGGQSGKTGSEYSLTTTEKFTAPTTGLQDVYFTTGTNEDAANFNKTKKRLARYVGTCNYRGAAAASLVIETMTNPIFTVTKRPDQPILKTASGDKIDKAQEKILILDYGVEIANYIEDQRETRIEDPDWKENGPKLWNLVLPHCPKTVTLKLEAQPGYEVQILARDPIQLSKCCATSRRVLTLQKTRPWRSSNLTLNSTSDSRARPCLLTSMQP